MTDYLAENIEAVIALMPTWGYLIIFLLMTIESSFIPFPSEVVMIPAGFLAYRGALSCHLPPLDAALALLVGILGSLAGAIINYALAYRLGRPFLHKYGRFVLLSEDTLNRSEEIFRKYGDTATLVCRLLPAIRQLISLPAGLCHMDFRRFSLLTSLGAGFWCIILLGIGWYFGRCAGDLTYAELVRNGTRLIHDHYLLLFLGAALLLVGHLSLQHFVMKRRPRPTDTAENKP